MPVNSEKTGAAGVAKRFSPRYGTRHMKLLQQIDTPADLRRLRPEVAVLRLRRKNNSE